MRRRAVTETGETRGQALSEADYAALAGFRRAIRRFLAFSEEAARAAGLTPQQHQAILAIRGFGGRAGLSVGELAEHLLVQHHSAVELVDRLVEAGLATRAPSRTDRRRVDVRLTRKARDLLRGLSRAHLAELSRAAPDLVAALSVSQRGARREG
jgi:DNA-binding MarR family transcriptional regulator